MGSFHSCCCYTSSLLQYFRPSPPGQPPSHIVPYRPLKTARLGGSLFLKWAYVLHIIACSSHLALLPEIAPRQLMQLHIHSLKAGGAPECVGQPGPVPVSSSPCMLQHWCFHFYALHPRSRTSLSEAVVVFISIMGGHIARALMPCERTEMLFPFSLHQSAGCAAVLP